MKILSSFTNPYVIRNMIDFRSSLKHERKIFLGMNQHRYQARFCARVPVIVKVININPAV